MSSLDSLHPSDHAPSAPVQNDELLQRTRRIAEELLAPQAEATDQSARVPRSHLDALAGAGLLGLSGPRDHGGQAAPGSVSRAVFEILAGACGVTHFVQAQHHGPVGMLASTENNELKERWLRPLCEGRVLAGVAFSHLRRPGKPSVSALPVDGGYRIVGEAPWVTSWGLAGLFVIAAMLPEDRILYFCHDGAASDDFIPSLPLALAAMNASSTVRLSFRDLFIPHEAVVRIVPAPDWRERDKVGTAHANPAVFGIARTCVDSLRTLGESRSIESVTDTAHALAEELDECRAAAYRAVDSGPGAGYLPDLLALKAWSLDLVTRAAHSLIAAVGGRAMSLDHPAQRLMREAMFYTIQAQTSAVRDATLHRLRETAFRSPLASGIV